MSGPLAGRGHRPLRMIVLFAVAALALPIPPATATGAIASDTTPPTVTTPMIVLSNQGSQLVGGRVPFRLFYEGTDSETGIDHYILRQSFDGAPYQIVDPDVVTTFPTRLLWPGHRYRFGIQAVDGAGNPSAIAYSASFRPIGVQDSSSAIRYHGVWYHSTSAPTWWGGTARFAKTAGASASFTFTGRWLEWVTLRAPDRGIAGIYIDGIRFGAIDLWSATVKRRVLAFVISWPKSETHTLTITVGRTTIRRRVDVDGFIYGG